jgi:hypothetical protein
MNFPALSSTQVEWIASQVAAYIMEQRQKYAPLATPLTSAEKQRLTAFFPDPVLDAARIRRLEKDGRVENPVFYKELERWGFPARILPDFRDMAAVTFVDTIVAHDAMSQRTLFHELVHVVQFRKLGLETFSADYVSGFVSGGGYDGIPLERNAYELEARFAADRARPFDVATEVQSWIESGRF